MLQSFNQLGGVEIQLGNGEYSCIVLHRKGKEKLFLMEQKGTTFSRKVQNIFNAINRTSVCMYLSGALQ